jgi:hypothetical protein
MDKELKKAIAAIVKYNRYEKKDWEQCVGMLKGMDYRQPRYDPALCPGHIYHTIQKLKQFIK